MAKVRIVVGCLVDGEQQMPGDVVDVADDVAIDLLALGRAVPDTPEPQTATQPTQAKAVRKTASKGRRTKKT